MRPACIVITMFAVATGVLGQTLPGAQGRKVGDFANVPEPPANTLIRCGTLIDERSEPRKSIDVVLKDARIVEVRPTAYDQFMPGGTKVVDLSSETCLPGLIDTHTHVLLQEIGRAHV